MGIQPYIKIFTLVFSGLGLFLYGMNLMSEGLEKAAGSKMKKIVAALTTNKFTGILVGAFVTAIVQSSSASTVMVVGFVNAGIMNLNQAIGIIMGANIGTTVTSVIVALKLTKVAPYAIGIGVFLLLFSKNNKTKKYSQIILGFGLLFLGMETMKNGMVDIRESDFLSHTIASFNEESVFNTIIGVLVGFLITAIVQSSSATTGILVGLAATGNITLISAFPILLGTNIGTCVTALISSAGASKNAKRAALMHLIFNVIGTIIFIVLLRIPTIMFIEKILVAKYNLSAPAQVAAAHVIFNIVTTFILMWFSPLIVKASKFLIKESDDEVKKENGVKYLDNRILETPSIAMVQLRREVLHMANLSLKQINYAVKSFVEQSENDAKKTFELEKTVNSLEHAIASYLVKLANTAISYKDREVIDELFSIIGDIERVGDHADNIAEISMYVIENDVIFSPVATEEAKEMGDLVITTFEKSIVALKDANVNYASSVIEKEGKIDTMEKNLRKKHIRRLNEGKCQPSAGVLFLEIVNNYERIGDHASNIARKVIDMKKENN